MKSQVHSCSNWAEAIWQDTSKLLLYVASSMVGYSILTSQTASVSVLTIMCHIDLSTSHNYHGPVWQTVCKKSLVIARNFIFMFYCFHCSLYRWRTKILVFQSVTVLYQISRHSSTLLMSLFSSSARYACSLESLHKFFSEIAMNLVYTWISQRVYYHLFIFF